MRRPDALSPHVVDDGWGFVEVEELGRLRDAKLWPGGGRSWDWNETGTQHRPGIQPADVLELLEHGADVVVLSRGRQLMLATAVETLSLLESHRVEVIRLQTEAAIAEHNKRVDQGQRVGTLLHSTC
jgi:hypothetical protein